MMMFILGYVLGVIAGNLIGYAILNFIENK